MKNIIKNTILNIWKWKINKNVAKYNVLPTYNKEKTVTKALKYLDKRRTNPLIVLNDSD